MTAHHLDSKSHANMLKNLGPEKKEIIFFIFLEVNPSFGLVETCAMYYKLTVEHQECNIATNWLIVFDDQNEEGFPL